MDFFAGTLVSRRENCSPLSLLPPEPEAEKECPGLQIQLSSLFTKRVRTGDTRSGRDGSEVKHICCSFRSPGFQALWLKQSVTSVLEGLMPSSGLCQQ